MMATPHGTSTKAGAQENPLLLGEFDDVADRQQAAPQEVGHHGAPDLWSFVARIGSDHSKDKTW